VRDCGIERRAIDPALTTGKDLHRSCLEVAQYCDSSKQPCSALCIGVSPN
jgi:hypothetical protein